MCEKHQNSTGSGVPTLAGDVAYEISMIPYLGAQSLRRSTDERAIWVVHGPLGNAIRVLSPDQSSYIDSALRAMVAARAAQEPAGTGQLWSAKGDARVVPHVEGKALRQAAGHAGWTLHSSSGRRLSELDMFDSSLVDSVIESFAMGRMVDMARFSNVEVSRLLDWGNALQGTYPATFDATDRALAAKLRALVDVPEVPPAGFQGEFQLDGSKIVYSERRSVYHITVSRVGGGASGVKGEMKMAERMVGVLQVAGNAARHTSASPASTDGGAGMGRRL